MKRLILVHFVVFLSIVIGITPKDSHKNSNVDNVSSEFNETPERSFGKKSATYMRAPIPFQIFQCMEKFDILRCVKLLLLQRIEGRTNFPNSGNITRDFLDTVSHNHLNLPNLWDKSYANISDSELTSRLLTSFQDFFKDRDIKLHFIPGMALKIVPSKTKTINLSLKKDRGESYGRKKQYKFMMQLGVPALVLPAVLMGTFLPFMLPALKMATLMTLMVNNGALLAAIMNAVRTAALNNDAQSVDYSHGGYH